MLVTTNISNNRDSNLLHMNLGTENDKFNLKTHIEKDIELICSRNIFKDITYQKFGSTFFRVSRKCNIFFINFNIKKRVEE